MSRLLITGASGYVGSRLAQRYLATTSGQVVLWTHGTESQHAALRRAAFEERYERYGNRVTFASGDLKDDGAFDSVDPSSITEIVHGAALTQFNIAADVADVTNRAGSERLFAFAMRCPRLRHMAYLSTVYSTGLSAGTIAEALPSEEPAFANHYEASKHRAERVLQEKYDALPWSILRLATVIADDESGQVTQVNAFHNTLQLLRFGLLPLLPGEPQTPLYFVTGAFVVESILSIISSEGERDVWNLCHSRAEMPTIEILLDITFDAFRENAEFRARRLLRPPYASYPAFQALVTGLDGIGNPVTSQAIQSVTPFAPQLYIAKTIENDRVRALNGGRAPDMTRLLSQTCRSVIRTRLGRLQ